MKEIFIQCAAYNIWVNTRLFNVAEKLSEEQQLATINSSFDSLYKTVLHMLDAESMWWQRLKLLERVEPPSQRFSGDFSALSAALLKQNREWQAWIANATEAQLQHEFIYRNTKREGFKQPVWQMLVHLFNHETHHRGQVVTMLRQLDVKKIPATDFIVWARR